MDINDPRLPVLVEERARTGKAYGELTMLRKDGSGFPVELSSSVFVDRHGEKKTSMVIRDITERKRAEEQILKANRVYAVISQINQAIVRISSEDKLFEEVCRIAIDFGKFQMAWIELVDEETKIVKPITFSGVEDGYLTKIKKISISDVPEGRGPTGTAIREGKHFICDDIENDPCMAAWKDEALKRGYRSSIALPIKLFGKVIGAFSLYAPTTHFFDQKEIDLLDEVVNDISFALESIETEKKRQEAVERLKQSENRFHTAFENAATGMCLNAPEGNFLQVNKALCRMLGYSSDELLNATLAQITHPDDISLSMKSLARSVEGKEDTHHFEKRYLRKNGDVIWAEISSSLLRGTKGEPLYFINQIIDITQRKRAEEALRESESKYRTLFETANDAIFLMDRDIFIDCNAKTLEMFGCTREQIIRQPPYRFSPKVQSDGRSSKDKALEKINAAFTGQTQFFEWQHSRYDGTLFNAEVSLNTFTIAGKDYLLAIVRDITKRKLAEEALRESEEKYRSIFDNVRDCIYTISPEGILMTINPEFEPLTGWSVKEWLGKSFTELVHPDDLPKAINVFQKILSGEKVEAYELRIITKSGEYRIGEFTPSPSKSGDKIVGALGIARDITERKRAEEEIKLTNKELETINKTIVTSASTLDLNVILEKVMDEAILVVGLEGGTICLINPDNTFDLAVERGASQETIEDLSKHKIKIGDCLCGNCAKECKPLILQTKEEVLEYATREVLRGEDIRFHAAFPFVVGEKCVGVLCVFTRTDKKPTQRNLKLLESIVTQTAIAIENARLYEEVKKYTSQLEKIVSDRTAELQTANKELEAFSYSVSHDLRAPLRAIDGFSRILSEDYEKVLDDEGKRLLNIVRTGTKKMDQLISDLLNLSRVGRTDMQKNSIDMRVLARSIYYEVVPADIREKFTFSVKSLPEAYGDSGLIRQVWINLISNAIKFTLPKSRRRIEIGFRVEGALNIYYVKDNGVGFNPEYSHKLFNVFQRLHSVEEFEGTGVGLAIVHRIIHRHGGKVWAEGKVDKGATFYFSLPGGFESR